jgi:hypothetical protein
MTHLILIVAALAAGPSASGREEATVRLHVRPMAAPRPAMKYQLLPELGELNPGNPAQEYLKCFMEQRPFFYGKEGVAQRARFQKMSLLDLRLEPLAQHYGGNALSRADWAARLDTLDWQALGRIRDGGLESLPAELGPLQLLAEALQVRFRTEVAANRFDDAIRTAKTMLAMGRHLGEHPAEVAHLIGLGAAHLGLDTLHEMVQQPGSPNLYWALTDLPSPVVDLHKGVQGDRHVVAAELEPIHDRGPMTDAELETFVSRLSGLRSYAREQSGLPPRSLRARLQAMAKDQGRLGAARRRLVLAGCAQGLVDKLPPLQIVLLDEKRDYETRRDDRIKLLSLPIWEIDSLAVGEERSQAGDGLFADLLPQIVKLRRTQGQLERQIALLRHVEALRLHAAGHDGKLPAKLSDIAVPIPVDPFTGKPFDYAVEGTTAHLRGGSPRSREHEPGHNIHYEVILLK